MIVENILILLVEDIEVYVIEVKVGVGVGYLIGYLFGVLFLILGINFILKIFRFDVEKEKEKYFV